MASKIIVIGAINGSFTSVFEKLRKLHSKTSFSFAIVVGDLFPDPANESADDATSLSSLLHGQVEIPLPVYFTLGRHALPTRVTEKLESAGGEVCPNLYFLGKRSTTKTSEGIRIVTLSGSLDTDVASGLSKDKYFPFHTENDAKSLNGANNADILLTTCWPTSIRTGSKVTLPEGAAEPASEQCIADLCANLRPRYHFSTSGDLFFEREPFFHQPNASAPEARPITRFISLASSTSPSKAKWLYAFSLDPTASVPLSLPAGTTASPLAQSRKRALPDQGEVFSRFSSPHNNHHHHSSKRRRNQPPPGPSECFFCLSNPTLSTHLITSIATDSYLTTARGPLTSSTTFSSLSFPAHILIIPLSHSPNLSSITDPTSRSATYAEMQRYRTALHSMLAAQAKGRIGAVTWEINRQNRGVHFHWQFLPVQRELISKGLVEAAFRVEAENEGWKGMQRRDFGEGLSEGDYFRVWIWMPAAAKTAAKATDQTQNGNGDGDGAENNQNRTDESNDAKESNEAQRQQTEPNTIPKDKEFSLIQPIDGEMRFDVQFGRRVMAKLLRLEKRVDWKECQQSEAEETRDAEGFKEVFKGWDFSLEEDGEED